MARKSAERAQSQPENEDSMLLDTASFETEATIAHIIRTAIFSHVIIDGEGRKTTIVMNRRQIAVVVSEILKGVPRATVTVTPRTRSPEEEWTVMGINKVDPKGRLLIPAKIRETCPPTHMYRGMNPTKKYPAVIILSQEKIQPTNILLGPMPVSPDNVGHIYLKDFEGGPPIIPPGTEAVFHKRGDLIIVLPENAPAPDQEFIDRYVQPIPSTTPFAKGTAKTMSPDRSTVTSLIDLVHDQVRRKAESHAKTVSRQRGRGDETWTAEGPHKVDGRRRVAVPVRLRKDLDTEEFFMYTGSNPNGQAPVVILSTAPVSPTNRLLGPRITPADGQGRILLSGFSEAEKFKVTDSLTFHRRGDIIIILHSSAPAPDTEFLDEFIQ